MPDAFESYVDDSEALRKKRLIQVSGAALAGLLIAVVAFLIDRVWSTAGVLAAGAVMMLVCQVLGRTGRVAEANLLLLVSLTAMASGLMWTGEGLRDSTLLLYPMTLILAGMLAQRRIYIALLVSMVLFLLLLTYATTNAGWRDDQPQERYWDYLRDIMLILSVSGFAIWVIINDLQRAIVLAGMEIAKYRASQKELTYLSQHDTLTGLPNRGLGRERVEQAIAQAQRQNLRVALLFVDMDHFKTVNDSLGHASGDDFLQQVARRLLMSVRRADIVARQGGDEFVIGLTQVVDAQAVSTAAAHVMGALSRPFQVLDTEISISCSIGVALYPDDGQDYEALLRCADMAMYQAKEAGRNTVRFFDEQMNTSMQQNLRLVAQLRTALARQEFVLHYQPVVDLASGRLIGAEALVRWQHPQHGLVPPGDFIPAAEKSGLVVEMGEWVLREACRQMVAWQAQGVVDLVIAVNLSTVQFRRGNIETVVERALQHSGLAPALLELEITESTLVEDAEAFSTTLQRLKGLGVKLSIDDFGTGYSSLAYLQRFAVDKLKIDQSFVRRMREGPQERAVVSAIVQIARSLHLRTTAEGIEDDAVRQELLQLGCEQGQGYYFARPQPASDFLALACHWKVPGQA